MAIIPPRNLQPPTLTRFGVPTDITGALNGQLLMPKLKHRFRVNVTNFGNIPNLVDFTRQVVTAGRPQIQHGSTAMHSYNNIVYYANKPEWQSIQVSLRDDIGNRVSSLVSAQLQKQMNHYTQSAARSHVNYKFTMNLQTLDGSMDTPLNVLEDWKLEGCYLETAEYGDMDYGSSDPMTINLTIRYDNATQGSEIIESAINTALGAALAGAGALLA
jgi:hypothetical protein